MKKSYLVFFFFSLFFIGFNYHSFAKSGIFDRIGIIPEHGLYGTVPEENIDLFTGNLTLKFRDIVLPGPNGFDLIIWRVYNSKILRDRLPGSAWGMQQEPYSWVGLGWSMHMGRVHNYNSNEPVIEFPDGRWETTYPCKYGNYYITRSFLKYDKNNYILYFKNGVKWIFGKVKTINYLGHSESVRVVTKIIDSHGYSININYFSGRPILSKITDSMGRVVNFYVDKPNSTIPRLTRIEVKNANGRWVKYYYTVEKFSYGGYYKLTKYAPPELSPCTYEYYSGNYDHYELKKITTSFGAIINYEFSDHVFYFLKQSLETRVVSKKSINGDYWYYSYPSYNNSSTGTVEVDGPEYNMKVTYHAYSSNAPWKIGLIKEKWFTDGSYSEKYYWINKEISNNHWTVLSTDMGSIKAPLFDSIFRYRYGDAETNEEYYYLRGLSKYGLPSKIEYYGGGSGNKLKYYKTYKYVFENNNTFKNKYMLSYISNESTYSRSNNKIKETITTYYMTVKVSVEL